MAESSVKDFLRALIYQQCTPQATAAPTPVWSWVPWHKLSVYFGFSWDIVTFYACQTPSTGHHKFVLCSPLLGVSCSVFASMGGEMKVCQIGKEMLGTEESIPIDFI